MQMASGRAGQANVVLCLASSWVELFVITSAVCVCRCMQQRFVEWDATEAACLVVRGIQEIKNQNRGQSFTMLHFIEVFKGTPYSA